MTELHHVNRSLRLVRGIALTVVACAGLAIIGAIVLWDADFYAARDKWEHAKRALFGDWSPENWCPLGRVSDDCTVQSSFAAALEDSRDFTFFRTTPIGGTDLAVETGIRFHAAQDVADGKPSYQWCHLSSPDAGVKRTFDLATKSAEDPPVYAELSSLDESALAGVDLSADALSEIARTLCRFDN